jgi:hypothetical protein
MNNPSGRSRIGRARCFVLLGLVVAGMVLALSPDVPDPVRAQSAELLESIVVTGKRLPELVPDLELAQRIEAALHDDPYLDDGHITITVKNGVATLQGMVWDDWDLRRAIRLARRISGVKRIVDELEIRNYNYDFCRQIAAGGVWIFV